MNTHNKIYLSTEDACKYLNISSRTLARKRNEGKVKFYQDGRLIRFKTADLDEYMQEHVMETFSTKGGSNG